MDFLTVFEENLEIVVVSISKGDCNWLGAVIVIAAPLLLLYLAYEIAKRVVDRRDRDVDSAK